MLERNHHVIFLAGVFRAVSNFGFHTLSKHPTGAQMLRDVGAVEFLTQLSPNVDPHLRTSVDKIFDQLFHLPEVLPSCPPTTTTYQPHSVPLPQTGLEKCYIDFNSFYSTDFCRCSFHRVQGCHIGILNDCVGASFELN